jgi:hypothetical protein
MKKLALVILLGFCQLYASAQHLVGVEGAYSNAFPSILNLSNMPESINGGELRLVYQYKNRDAFLFSVVTSFNRPKSMVGDSWAELGMYSSNSHEITKHHAAVFLEPSVCLFPIPNFLFLRFGGTIGYNGLPSFKTTSINSGFSYWQNKYVTDVQIRELTTHAAFNYGFIFGSGFQIILHKNVSLKLEAQYRISNIDYEATMTNQTNGGPLTTENVNFSVRQTSFLPSLGLLYSLQKLKN